MNAIALKRNMHSALGQLTDGRLLRQFAYSDGRWTHAADGASFEVRDPFSGEHLAHVASLGADETTAAIDAAERALPAWKALAPQERAARLRTWFELIKAAREDLALLMTLEQGKPLAESRGEIDYAASFVEWFAEEGKRLGAESPVSHLPGAQMLVTREPSGNCNATVCCAMRCVRCW